METKQVIVIRKDLNMRRGKEIAQGAHASISFLVEAFSRGNFGRSKEKLSSAEHTWLQSGMKKICVSVASEAELLDIHKAALADGLSSHLIRDSGKTEFGGRATLIACAIGPDDSVAIDKITSELALY